MPKFTFKSCVGVDETTVEASNESFARTEAMKKLYGGDKFTLKTPPYTDRYVGKGLILLKVK